MRTLTACTRERITAAAARLFSVQRFHEVRMEDLAVEAEVGKGTLYRYFHDKEDLYRDLIATAAHEILRIVEERPQPGDPAETQLVAILGGMIDYFVSHPYFFDLFQHVEALSGWPSPWCEVRAKMLARIETLLTDESLGVEDAASGCLMLLGSVRSLCRFGKQPHAPDMAERIVRAFLYGTAKRAGAETP